MALSQNRQGWLPLLKSLVSQYRSEPQLPSLLNQALFCDVLEGMPCTSCLSPYMTDRRTYEFWGRLV